MIRKLFSSKAPALSVVVIVYDMPQQAEKTLSSLTAAYQRGVDIEDYEVIVVENSSAHCMQREFIAKLPENFKYFCREENVPTPLPAIAFGVTQSRGQIIGMVIDGARLVSPGAIAGILQCNKLHEQAVVSIPGYHLGENLQQESTLQGYDEAHEAQLLASVNWPEDGYRLFDISCLSGSCRNGYILPVSESNFLSMPLNLWHKLGGIEQSFTTPGGGFANLDLYKRACEHPDSKLYVLPGEGTFHQYHGGVTTGGKRDAEREALMQAQREQYETLRGQPFSAPPNAATLVGQMHPSSYRFLAHSVTRAQQASGANS